MLRLPPAKYECTLQRLSNQPSPPTPEVYGLLQRAYTYFNDRCFEGTLPPCLITLQRKGPRVRGYFSPKRFRHTVEQRTTDEIALNPLLFNDTIDVLQTLVHEMVHLWQAHFGKPSRSAYHNAQWAQKMKSIGLQPSDTGLPGGRETGQHMSDYPLEGGLFADATIALLTSGFHLTWYDSISEMHLVAPADPAVEPQLIKPATLSGKRMKFSCPRCQLNAWAKVSARLICGTCQQTLTPNRK